MANLELVKIDSETEQWARLKDLALNSCRSPHSKRSYSTSLDDWRRWFNSARPPVPFFSKACVNAYRDYLESRGLGSGTINVRLAAIKKLTGEAVDNGLIAPELGAGIGRVHGIPRLGTRMGNWLTREQAERLISTPDAGTMAGKRDRAILGVLIGCGLRRSEACSLTMEHIQQREGRWVIVDLVGKHGRVRSVPMPAWTKALLDAWTLAAAIESGHVFRPVNRGGRITAERIVNTKAIWVSLAKYASAVGVPHLAPHDLRRTYAKLAHTGRAALEQIQISLGHASITTTERYLGVRQDFSDAPCDHLGLNIKVA